MWMNVEFDDKSLWISIVQGSSSDHNTAYRFFPGLKSHEAIWTAHWRIMASSTIAIFSSHVHMRTNQQNVIRKIAELEILLVCGECLKPMIL